jgi:hypothetical protein
MLNEFEKEHAELDELKKQVAGMAAVIERLERERSVAVNETFGRRTTSVAPSR